MKTNDKPSRRYIPKTIEIKREEMLIFKEHFKLVKNDAGEYKMFISPLFRNSLDELKRGRTSQTTRKKLSGFAKMLSEKVDTNVRGIFKKYTNKINGAIGMFEVVININEVNNDVVVVDNPYLN